MGKFTRAPVYLSEISKFEKKQMKAVNELLKSYYNRIQSKAAQKQLNDTISAESVVETSGRVTDLVCYTMNDIMYAYFTFNPSYIQTGIDTTFIFSIEVPEGMHVADIQCNGYESDSMRTSLATKGYFNAQPNSGIAEIYFYKTSEIENMTIFKVQLMIFLGEETDE